MGRISIGYVVIEYESEGNVKSRRRIMNTVEKSQQRNDDEDESDGRRKGEESIMKEPEEVWMTNGHMDTLLVLDKKKERSVWEWYCGSKGFC